MRVLIAAALLATCTVSHAAELPRDILGLQLGGPLDLPECNLDKPAQGLPPPCWRGLLTSNGEQAIPRGRVSLWFFDKPSWVQDVDVSVVHGTIELVVLTTRGLDVQDEALAALIEKYGKPTEQSETPLQTMLGATFMGRDAVWNSSDVQVTFAGAASEVSTGVVLVTSAAGRAWQEKLERDAKARQPRL